MKPILEIQNISKQFKIYHEQLPYESIRSKLMNPLAFFKHRDTELFWALKNISFNILQGESIGIIGKNGAGKSTLLKILSKITPPSSGKITSRGRIASLLEVGTGFHPELTGRENVFLNGSILGMKRRDITSKFEEIVEFSGVEKFLDTQLKHYSSGMQLRLAFAVAAFLEPEILVIDEVLAVGDSEFQKKCMGKMSEVSRSGRTVIFVSHNLSAVSQLCSKAILLEKGSLVMEGQSSKIIDNYLSQFNKLKNSYLFSENEHKNEFIKIEGIEIYAVGKKSNQPSFMDEEIKIEIKYLNYTNIYLDITIDLFDDASNHVFHVGTICSHEGELQKGAYVTTAVIPANLLNSKNYFINLIFGQNQRIVLMKIDYIAAFRVVKVMKDNSINSSQLPGIIHPLLKWKTQNQA